MLNGWKWLFRGRDAVCLPIAGSDGAAMPTTQEFNREVLGLARSQGLMGVRGQRFVKGRAYFAEMQTGEVQ